MSHGSRYWVPKAEHNEVLRRESLLREELAQAESVLALERRRYEAAFGEALRRRYGKTALTMDALEFMLSEVAGMLPMLDAGKATTGVARRVRAILGIPKPRAIEPTLLSPMCCCLCQEGHDCPVHQ